jgi:hypothetical protein
VTFDPVNKSPEVIDQELEALCGRHLLVGTAEIGRFIGFKSVLVDRLLEAGKIARAWRRASTGEWVAVSPAVFRDRDGNVA